MYKTGDLFPFNDVRPVQKEMMDSVHEALQKESNLISHAPTGLGKTVASLAPALEYALDNNKVIFFLTSRHTQHKIAIETMKEIKKAKGIQFNVVDFIGKKSMCMVPGVQSLSSSEFLEYCRTVSRKDYTCEFYTNTRKQGLQATMKAQEAVTRAKNMDLDKLLEFCSKERLCPYEISMMLAEKARVVVCDYNYIFNDSIRNMILGKMDRVLSDCIVIIDEGHNLPFRIRDLMTSRITKNVLEKASKEAKKFQYMDISEEIDSIANSLITLAGGLNEGDEKKVKNEEFSNIVEHHAGDVKRFIEDLEDASDSIREEQKQSFVGSFGMFLKEWTREEDGFARILTKRDGYNEPNIILSYRCLDPAVVSRDIVNSTHSSILMSGTLIPVEMYRDLLEVHDPIVKVFPSPFPEKNRLNMLIPDVTTKFTHRNERQFQKIARICASITNNVPGNSAIFFPSYSLRDKVNYYLRIESNKSQLVEESGMSQEEKNEIVEKLEGYKDTGIILLGASSGSFGEGVDFPGDLLKCVIIVGLPLRTPDLETKETIEYFDRKFGKGWNYGYIFPAFNLTLQNAGRCIRSETDKGIVVFLDERYSWGQYSRCFPDDVKPKVPEDFEKEVMSFFNGGLQQTLIEEDVDMDDLDDF
ncbi:MAG: ATP-dependent DNA helicase [Candidatus Woesearchaeota archaeon]